MASMALYANDGQRFDNPTIVFIEAKGGKFSGRTMCQFTARLGERYEPAQLIYKWPNLLWEIHVPGRGEFFFLALRAKGERRRSNFLKALALGDKITIQF